MGYALLGLEDVIKIKQAIWEGKTLEVVARLFDLSIGYTGNISSGHAYDYVPWPDGSCGPLPRYRKKEILSIRKALGKSRAIETSRIAQDYAATHKDKIASLAEQVAAQLEQENLNRQSAIKHTDTSIPDVRTINVVMDGRDIEYVPQTEMPKLPDDLQELYDAVKEDGFIAEVAFGAVVARLPVATWTKERIDPLYQKMRPFIQQLARADRETFKPTQKSN